MTTELQDRVQAAVAHSFTIERELGGGAMSRVFLATELSLGRKVVLKVLPPELAAGISVERFRREVLVTASLQHPFIVPVLAAGDAGGSPYYSMPFVAGESLRSRLQRDGKLTIAASVDLIHDVAAALAYAHANGVVHRDLKPENVLLSGGHAVVTDFGVAKAISAATGASGPASATVASHATLTEIGITLGTPAYMAPEQAAADPSTDHRADLYALGVIAYELLAGRTPFGSRTPQQMIAAHLSEAPRPITDVEPALPSNLASLVMRLLEKDPAARPQRADDVVQELATARGRIASGVAIPAASRRTAKVAVLFAGAIVAVVAAAVVVLTTRSKPASASVTVAPRVIVVPFDDRSTDHSLGTISAMTGEWITHGIRESGAVDVLEPNAARGASAAADPATIAAQLGAGFAVAGSVFRLGDSVRLSARIIDARARQVVRTIPEVTAALATPMPAIELVRQRVIGALATTVDSAISQFAGIASQPPSFDAYREYIQSRAAHLRGDQRVALTHAYRAVALDSAFTLPYVVITFAHMSIGECNTTDSLLRALEPRRAKMPVYDRLQLDRVAAICAGDPQAAYDAAAALRRFAPRSTQTAAGLGDQALHIGHFHESVATYDSLRPDDPAMRGFIGLAGPYAAALHWTGNFDRQLALGQRISRINPALPGPIVAELGALAALGRADEVLARAREIEAGATVPDSFVGVVLRAAAGELEAHTHDAQAQAAWRMAIDWHRGHLAPNAAWAEEGLTWSLAGAKLWKESHDHLPSLAKRLAGDLSFEGSRAVIAQHVGARSEVDAVKQLLTKQGNARAHYWLGLIAASEGDRSAAVAHIREALAHGLGYDIYDLHVEPMLAPLRGYAEFDQLTRSADR